MGLGPANIAIVTPLPVGNADASFRAHEEPLPYTLTPISGPGQSELPSAWLVHTAVGPLSASAVWDAEQTTLRVTAGSADLSVEGLLHVAYLLLEAELQCHGYLTLHAAAACRDGKAVLLLGPTGAGKTTTLLRLCRDHGTALVGNDLVVAGGPGRVPMTLAGSLHLRLRHTSIAQVMPDLLGLFPGEITDSWRAKRNLAPARLGIDIAGCPAEIILVAFIHVDVAYRDLVDEPGDTLVHRLNLHENALRYIRATATPWFKDGSFGPYLPSLDGPTAHSARTATLERLLRRSRYIAGPPASVAEHVSALLADSRIAQFAGVRSAQ